MSSIVRLLSFLALALCVSAGAQEGLPQPAAPVASEGARPTGDHPSMAPSTNESYQIQAGDTLTIAVWKETDLQADVLVRSDGGISFPLAGDLVAAGRTVAEVRADLVTRIQHYIPGAVVTVAVKHIGGNRIYVVGKVNRPGEFEFSQPIDVMQALSLAGGATAFASLNDIRILRRENGQQSSLPFRYADVAKGRHLERNIVLHSGDTVVVP
jgi:polysaccharide export outer membrane protein